MSVLSRGLTFSPMRKLDKFDFIKDTYLFCRKIVLKLLHDKPMMSSSLERDDREILRDLMDLLEENQTGRNLTREEQQAINDLKNNKDFLIKEADKGGNVVLWPLDKYICEALRQLNDRNYYQQLPSDPTDYFQRRFTHILDSALEYGVISKKELEYLQVKEPRIATFYMLPKVHKNRENPPGRPIISGIGSLCERATTYIDFSLQPLVTALPSYLRDSLHLMQMIKDIQIPKGTLLVTCDVESLYSNIGHQDGICAITYYLEQQVNRDIQFDSFLITLLDFVLHHNFFTFDNKFFLQISGTAMGARCAPSYANLFMGWWEGTHVYPSPYFHHVLKWFRFIDDILFLWTGTQEECLEFISFLNQNNVNVRLTHTISPWAVEFLDLRIETHLEGDPYRTISACEKKL
ncbi:uncharacterized protein LOC130355563 isoform X1 [Hyla sarda]|uniref:uncharacterized protein LOC130355563 isoform X1 n=1 Tax=Hyla sarda TaxID=327740 RepID=UPI0024C2E575|nr:uncharacterized protein LOC130355563 isoform X1 [Hyla sarda]